jgi:acyl-CoA-dependent ceramide synthase
VIVGPFFALFIGVWVYLRHYLNLVVLWATLTEFATVGPFELNWETQQYKCWISQYITFALLASLQAINLFWLYYILRIAKNYVFNSDRRDERSDDEEEEEVESDSKGQPAISEKVNGTKPVVLLNGQPVGDRLKGDVVRERKRRG